MREREESREEKVESRKGIARPFYFLHLLSIFFPLAANAAKIETTDWGVCWSRPAAWPAEIDDTDTAGSGTCDLRRIYVPHVYPFLDGFDTRAYVASHSGRVPNWPTHTTVYARFVAGADFFARTDALRHQTCGTNVVWGSSSLATLLTAYNFAAQTSFGWERNPTARCWNGRGSAWMPTFRSLVSGRFVNAHYAEYAGGFAAQEGWSAVSLREPGVGTFAYYVSHGGTYPATTNWTMETVLNEVYKPLYYPPRTNATYRLYYDDLAAAHQTLSVYDRTYHVPGALVAITNEYSGTASVRYPATCNARPHVVVNGTDVELKLGEWEGGFDFTVGSPTATISATNWPCAYHSPRGSVSDVIGGASVGVSVPDARATCVLTAADLEELIAAPETGDYILRAEPGETRVDFWLVKNGQQYGTRSYRPIPYPPSGEYEAELTGAADAGYAFHRAFAVAVQPSAAAHWRYPTNTVYLADTRCRHTFFRSYAAIKSYVWRSINFKYGDADGDWADMLDYGYAASDAAQQNTLAYTSNLAAALALNAAKCRALLGNGFDTDPASYSGMTDSDAIRWLGNVTQFTCRFEHTCLGNTFGGVEEHTLPIHVEVNGGTVTMTPPTITLVSTGVDCSGGYVEGGALRDARTADTRIKGVIEANWNFPQIHRK